MKSSTWAMSQKFSIASANANAIQETTDTDMIAHVLDNARETLKEENHLSMKVSTSVET